MSRADVEVDGVSLDYQAYCDFFDSQFAELKSSLYQVSGSSMMTGFERLNRIDVFSADVVTKFIEAFGSSGNLCNSLIVFIAKRCEPVLYGDDAKDEDDAKINADILFELLSYVKKYLIGRGHLPTGEFLKVAIDDELDFNDDISSDLIAMLQTAVTIPECYSGIGLILYNSDYRIEIRDYIAALIKVKNIIGLNKANDRILKTLQEGGVNEVVLSVNEAMNLYHYYTYQSEDPETEVKQQLLSLIKFSFQRDRHQVCRGYVGVAGNILHRVVELRDLDLATVICSQLTTDQLTLFRGSASSAKNPITYAKDNNQKTIQEYFAGVYRLLLVLEHKCIRKVRAMATGSVTPDQQNQALEFSYQILVEWRQNISDAVFGELIVILSDVLSGAFLTLLKQKDDVVYYQLLTYFPELMTSERSLPFTSEELKQFIAKIAAYEIEPQWVYYLVNRMASQDDSNHFIETLEPLIALLIGKGHLEYAGQLIKAGAVLDVSHVTAHQDWLRVAVENGAIQLMLALESRSHIVMPEFTLTADGCTVSVFIYLLGKYAIELNTLSRDMLSAWLEQSSRWQLCSNDIDSLTDEDLIMLDEVAVATNIQCPVVRYSPDVLTKIGRLRSDMNRLGLQNLIKLFPRVSRNRNKRQRKQQKKLHRVSATKIQSLVRAFLARRRAHAKQAALGLLQRSLARHHQRRKQFRHGQSIRIQKHWRGYHDRLMIKEAKRKMHHAAAATAIQRVVRGFRARQFVAALRTTWPTILADERLLRSQYQEKLSNLQRRYEQAQQNVANLTVTIKTLEGQVGNQTALIDTLKDQLLAANRQADTYRQKIEAIQSLLAGLQADVKTLKQDNHRIRSERDQLRQEIVAVKQTMTEADKHHGETVTAWRERYDALHQDRDKIRAILEQTRAELATSVLSYKQLEDRFMALLCANKQLHQDNVLLMSRTHMRVTMFHSQRATPAPAITTPVGALSYSVNKPLPKLKPVSAGAIVTCCRIRITPNTPWRVAVCAGVPDHEGNYLFERLCDAFRATQLGSTLAAGVYDLALEIPVLADTDQYDLEHIRIYHPDHPEHDLAIITAMDPVQLKMRTLTVEKTAVAGLGATVS